MQGLELFEYTGHEIRVQTENLESRAIRSRSIWQRWARMQLRARLS